MHVGNDVWIGVMQKYFQVKINDIGVIGANFLVTKNVLPMLSSQENPAKLLNINLIMKLLKSYLILNGGTLKKKNL